MDPYGAYYFEGSSDDSGDSGDWDVEEEVMVPGLQQLGPIHRAAYEGNEADVSRLVEEDGRRLDAQIGPRFVYLDSRWDVTGCTPLMLAAGKGCDAVVARLIELGADVGLSAAMGWSAAHFTCTGAPASTLALLLDAGVPLNVRDDIGMTPLILAASHGAVECVEFLLARGGDALELDAATNGGLRGRGWTALHVAAGSGHLHIVQQLLRAGANPTLRDNKGRTPLDFASLFGASACIPLLEAALAEPQRPRSLLKARALLDAAHAIPKAALDARTKGQPLQMERRASLAAAPAYLKGRAAEGRQLPAVSVVEKEGQVEERLVACVKYALGVEGGGSIVVEGAEAQAPQRMVKEVFVELCELLVPKWDRRNV